MNRRCTARIGGSPEYVNFAYLTKSGSPIGPPNPLQFQFIGSGDPHSSGDTFFMNQGDNLTVTLGDTPNGLKAVVNEHTLGTTGSMTASAANHFGQIKFQPFGHSCQEIDYTFRPMYSTSTHSDARSMGCTHLQHRHGCRDRTLRLLLEHRCEHRNL